MQFFSEINRQACPFMRQVRVLWYFSHICIFESIYLTTFSNFGNFEMTTRRLSLEHKAALTLVFHTFWNFNNLEITYEKIRRNSTLLCYSENAEVELRKLMSDLPKVVFAHCQWFTWCSISAFTFLWLGGLVKKSL